MSEIKGRQWLWLVGFPALALLIAAVVGVALGPAGSSGTSQWQPLVAAQVQGTPPAAARIAQDNGLTIMTPVKPESGITVTEAGCASGTGDMYYVATFKTNSDRDVWITAAKTATVDGHRCTLFVKGDRYAVMDMHYNMYG